MVYWSVTVSGDPLLPSRVVRYISIYIYIYIYIYIFFFFLFGELLSTLSDVNRESRKGQVLAIYIFRY